MSARRKVSGLHASESALQNSPEKIISAWVSDQRDDPKIARILDVLSQIGVPVQVVNRARLDSLVEGRNHQGVVLELIMPKELSEGELRSSLDRASKNALYLVLDHIQDPHNFGACLRTADAAGVTGVILTKDQSVGLTPVVAKVASGAAETVPIYRVTNLARTLDLMKESGVWIVGAAGEASSSAYQVDLDMPVALVIGAEGKGMRRLTRDRCDLLVKLPMLGQVESLNLSVATGILLYEINRQRGIF